MPETLASLTVVQPPVRFQPDYFSWINRWLRLLESSDDHCHQELTTWIFKAIHLGIGDNSQFSKQLNMEVTMITHIATLLHCCPLQNQQDAWILQVLHRSSKWAHKLTPKGKHTDMMISTITHIHHATNIYGNTNRVVQSSLKYVYLDHCLPNSPQRRRLVYDDYHYQRHIHIPSAVTGYTWPVKLSLSSQKHWKRRGQSSKSGHVHCHNLLHTPCCWFC